jgi:hypothetical protein
VAHELTRAQETTERIDAMYSRKSPPSQIQLARIRELVENTGETVATLHSELAAADAIEKLRCLEEDILRYETAEA